MAAGEREYVLGDVAGAGSHVLRALAAAGSDRLGWANGGSARTIRRTWLDTFDWRLYRAGLTLQQVIGSGQPQLLLTDAGGAVVAAERLDAASRPRWPRLAAQLPAGPLQAAVTPVVGVRALLPVARAISKVGELQALNEDAKTIARLAVDRMAVTYPARASVPARLTLVPVRGYQGQAGQVDRAIGTLPGVSASHGSALEAAFAAAGLRPGDQPGKSAAVRLAPEQPAATALAAILTSLLDSIEANVPGTVRDVDTEFLHDLRVAVRWTRSALKLCGDALPAGLAVEFRPEFRWLGDLTTPTRDLDVFLLGYERMTSRLVGASPADLSPFRDFLTASRAAAYHQLAAGLRSARFGRLRSNWRAALAGVRPTGRLTVAGLADIKIAAAHHAALRTGRKITASSPPESLHDLRKRCKELRYLVEMFGSLHDPARLSLAVRELKALQDCLGEFQDAQVQRAEIASMAAQLLDSQSASAPTLLAMGEIVAGLAVRQSRARAQFDGRFADFAGPGSRARMGGLARTSRA
ncbi:MAG TPA: CHAD domain-containing protein [Streptosporangiaceae bacterium]|nr:CHAD domain-containing protein [Streptosporangiaceae bacterium]